MVLLESTTAVTFLGLTAEGWTALGTVGLASLTAVLVAVGIGQIRSIRAEAKRGRTLAACDKYDTDPILDASLHRLSDARAAGELERNPVAFKTDIATVLNYQDAISIGIKQELYIEELARDHLEHVVKRTVALYLETNLAKDAGLNPENYRHLRALKEKWSATDPHFRERRLRLWRRSS